MEFLLFIFIIAVLYLFGRFSGKNSEDAYNDVKNQIGREHDRVQKKYDEMKRRSEKKE